MKEYNRFLTQGRIKARDDVHRLKILKAVSTYEVQVDKMRPRQFKDWEQTRVAAARVKTYVLDNLPSLLEEFESKILKKGAKVWWARTKDEAQKHFLAIADEHQAKKVVKSKSMTTEEIEFNEFCERNNIEVLESDLGELIVQLAGEKPYHIVTPAMHKSKAEIGKLFQEQLGAPETNDAEELTMIAREHLRNAYITSDIGVTGANFIIAREGALILTENEGNARLTMSCPPVHVVFVGIEKVLPRLSDLSLFLPLLATMGTGQQITGYNSIIQGPRQAGETDGPKELHIILLDNGRSELYLRNQYRSILKCIRCGACLNVCPVYRTIGGHSYLTTYQGPVGSVITPQLRDLKSWGHLASASSLCAACSDTCPVNIDIHHLLLENRWEMVRKNHSGMAWNLALKIWAWIMAKRSRLNLISRLARWTYRIFIPFMSRGKRKRIPDLPGKSFAHLWKKYEQQR
jgi:L-lactate dehydrogenase complex protein LldF